jgi:hypothetical protein
VTDAPEALFVADRGRVMPTDRARGPWSPDALHGGPVAALVARAVETLVPDDPVHVTRLTVELLRPVPVAPLTVTASLVRPGRKVQLVDVRIDAGGRDVVWGRALRVRTATTTTDARDRSPWGELPDATDEGPVPGVDDDAPPPPDAGEPSPEPVGGYLAFHNTGTEMRFVSGRFDGPGPAAVWVRLRVPVVEGEEPTPLQRVAAAADFGNGVSSVLDFARYQFINPDLTIYLHRPALGPWVCVDAATRLGLPGTGVAQSVLWDGHGPIGRALQGLVVEART